jgi:hypothetical protein
MPWSLVVGRLCLLSDGDCSGLPKVCSRARPSSHHFASASLCQPTQLPASHHFPVPKGPLFRITSRFPVHICIFSNRKTPCPYPPHTDEKNSLMKALGDSRSQTQAPSCVGNWASENHLIPLMTTRPTEECPRQFASFECRYPFFGFSTSSESNGGTHLVHWATSSSGHHLPPSPKSVV